MGPIEVHLSPEDEAAASEVGRGRDEASRAAGWTRKNVSGYDALGHDDLGARGEMAVIRAYGLGGWNLPPVRNAVNRNLPDVAGVDVRTTDRRNGRLLLHDEDANDRAHVLVISRGGRLYHVVGWVWGWQGKAAEFWDALLPKPCYAVPQHRLLDPRWLVVDRP